MMKTQLIKVAKISTNAMTTLGRNEDVRVEGLEKICLALDCKLDDIWILCQIRNSIVLKGQVTYDR